MHFETVVQQTKAHLMLAATEDLINYCDLAARLGMPKRGLNRGRDSLLGRCLAEVTKQCVDRELPLFSVLVIRKDTGMPGRGIDAAFEAAGVATKAELADPQKRAQVVAREQDRARSYLRSLLM